MGKYKLKLSGVFILFLCSTSLFFVVNVSKNGTFFDSIVNSFENDALFQYADIVNSNLEEAIRSGKKEVYFQDLLAVQWDKVCYITSGEAYIIDSQENSLSRILGHQYSGLISANRCELTSHNDLFFIRNNQLVAIIPLDNCSIQVPVNPAPWCFSINAGFTVEKSEYPFGGQEYLTFFDK